MKLNMLMLVVGVLCIVACSSVQAALTFEFGQSVYYAAPNSTVDVEVFLAASGADRNYLLGSSPGRIFALAARVNNDQVGVGARVVADTDIAVNTATFDDPLVPPVREADAAFARAAAFTNNPDGVSLPDVNPLRVRLATFRYTLGSAPGTTTLSFADFDGTTNIAASDGFGGVIALDSQVDFSRTASIVAVPEPSSFVLLGVAGVATFMRRRRMRARKASADSSSQ